MGKNKKKPSPSQTTSLKEHQQIGKKLYPPLAKLNVKPTRYSIDMLPELLLIDAAVYQLSWSAAPGALHRAFDILDQFVPSDSKDFLTGLITSMKLVPEDRRADARAALVDNHLDDVLWPEGLRHGLALYPECPAAWIFADWRKTNAVDWQEGISYLKGAVRRLWNSKGVHSTRCRMFPVARAASHGKLHFMRTPEQERLIDLLVGYPAQLTEDEQRQVEATSRSMFGALSELIMGERVPDWVPYFWRKNYDLSPCERLSDTQKEFIVEGEVKQVLSAIRASTEQITSAFRKAIQQAKLDLYDIDRDEVLFGLLGRQNRLFKVLVTNPSLWTADLGTMLHRIMVDTLITFKWLMKRNDPTLFYQFKQYSLGKQKLLHLHVQDLTSEGREELEQFAEELADEVNEEIWEELLSVDLGGNFANMDMRKMAYEVDLQEIYRLVYSPASSELHGEWTSLKKFNLVRCANPLHRFHRLPQLDAENYLSPQVVIHAGSILIETFLAWLDAYHLQHLSDDVKDFVPGLEASFSPLVG
jgi:hypothetical protein